MLEGYFTKIRDFAILDLFTRLVFLTLGRKARPRTMVIIKLDAIGDYILFRNFLEVIKKSSTYKDWRITLCGNIIWKDLAETFDRRFIDSFIWVDKEKFRHNFFYALSTLRLLLRERFEVALHPSYNRDVVSDFLTRAAGVRKRIGSAGDERAINMKPRQKSITDRYYTELIHTGSETLFEFFRYRKFFERALHESISIAKPFVDTEKTANPAPLDSPYAVVFPGASHSNRRWHTNNFAEVSDSIASKYKLAIAVCGSASDGALFEELKKKMKKAVPHNMTGGTLTELAKIIAGAEIVVTNDTSAAHMAVALGKKVVSLLNGRHFGRFSPYPLEITKTFRAVYPPKIAARIGANFSTLAEEYLNKTDASIQDIVPATVLEEIDGLLDKSRVDEDKPKAV